MYSNKLICQILLFINNNINDKITIADLEKRFFYNRYYIMKLFKKEIGITIIEYINSLRVYNTINNIRTSNYSLTSIAIRNGFSSLEYFSETFRQITGVNPRIFKDYFQHKKYISNEQSNLITDSIVNLYEISNIKNNYISKSKPDISPVKKFTIFKK